MTNRRDPTATDEDAPDRDAILARRRRLVASALAAAALEAGGCAETAPLPCLTADAGVLPDATPDASVDAGALADPPDATK